LSCFIFVFKGFLFLQEIFLFACDFFFSFLHTKFLFFPGKCPPLNFELHHLKIKISPVKVASYLNIQCNILVDICAVEAVGGGRCYACDTQQILVDSGWQSNVALCRVDFGRKFTVSDQCSESDPEFWIVGN
jgi:hypothetical protein